MALTGPEERFLEDFLQNISDNDLKSIAGSVSSGLMKAKSREQATSTIILNTHSLYALFNRKKMNRKLLFGYLFNKNWSMLNDPTKEEMCQYIFGKWGLIYGPKNTPSNYLPSIVLPSNQSMFSPIQAQQNSYLQLVSRTVAPMNMIANADTLSQMIRSRELVKDVNELALDEFMCAFSRTFYELFNKPNGALLHSFNETHFFAECKLRVIIKGGTEDINLEVEGVGDVLTVLSTLQKEHDLYYNPNIPEHEIPYKQDSHGLICLSICGTLHKRCGPVGVFEQVFILSRDPFARECIKIQETTLILRSSKTISSYSQLMLINRANPSSLGLESSAENKCTLALRDVR